MVYKISPKSEPAIELHSRAAPSVEAHHSFSGPDQGRNSGGRWIIKLEFILLGNLKELNASPLLQNCSKILNSDNFMWMGGLGRCFEGAHIKDCLTLSENICPTLNSFEKNYIIKCSSCSLFLMAKLGH